MRPCVAGGGNSAPRYAGRITTKESKMKTYYVTVEGVVSRVICVDADNVAEAMKYAKVDFINALGADNAVVVAANEEKTNA
jgi:hypothetical protein